MPHSSGFARLASGAFSEAIGLATFYEIIIMNRLEFLANRPPWSFMSRIVIQ